MIASEAILRPDSFCVTSYEAQMKSLVEYVEYEVSRRSFSVKMPFSAGWSDESARLFDHVLIQFTPYPHTFQQIRAAKARDIYPSQQSREHKKSGKDRSSP